MKSYLFLLFLLISVNFKSQAQHNSQRFPQFPKCVDVDFLQKEACFKNTLRAFILDNYQVPAEIRKEQYKGEVRVIFEVNQIGGFEIIYLDAVYPELKQEMVRVFELLPNIKPATYNSRPISVQFKMPIKIPLVQSLEFSENEDSADIMPQVKEDIVINEYDEIQPGEFTRPRYESQINIPLSHEYYSRFDAEFNRIGLNTHSASKPLLFSEVSKYYDFKAKENEMRLDVNSWVGRKLFNEHLVQYQTEDYWFTLDFALDLQIGKDFQQKSFDFTYNNTRALIFQGGLGANFNFYTVAYENQGRFAEYYNRFAASLRPDGGDPAIIPGRGIAKPFMDGGYDYPVAEGYLSYTPSKFFNIQFGHGKNFIGDGYRSLLMSDNASPYPYFKLNTTFWKLKYTNTWMSLRDVRPAVTSDGSFRTKYMANHYLSYNITKRLNIGLFESVVWQNDNNRGFDLNYLNPIIFYRAIEFSTGARGGNAIIGLTSKYKLSNKINFYGQIIIDEFSTTDVFGGQQSWKNKLGYQLGIKYFNAFNIPGLFLRTEYNQVRPYTYSHNTGVLNYGHNNQSMAHLWGSNFREILAIARYKSNRWYGNAKFIYGKRGFDYNVAVNQAAYGGDIYSSERQRPFDTDVEIGQGNTTISFFSNIEVGYIINPATNLKLYGSYIYRNFNPEVKTPQNFDNTTSWVNFGLRTDIFNWYYDY
jgi:hypothetical protein